MDTNPIIADYKMKVALSRYQTKSRARGSRVPIDVGKRFLGDAINRGLDGRASLANVLNIQRNVDSGAGGKSAHKGVQGSLERVGDQRGRVGEERQGTDFSLHFLQGFPALADKGVYTWASMFPIYPGQSELQRNQALGRGVVQVASYSPPLVFLCSKELASRTATLSFEGNEFGYVVNADQDVARSHELGVSQSRR